MQAIYILWLRQLKRYIRATPRIIGSLGQPILFLVALGFGLGPIFAKAGQGNYIAFIAPGVIAMSILFTSVFSGIQIIWDKQFGFLKETLVAPVSRMQIMIGTTLGGATVAMIQGIIVLIITSFIGLKISHPALLPITLIFMFLISLLFTGLGTAIGSTLNDMQGFQLITNFLVMPLFFLSGALFPLNGLPKAFEIITNLDPLTYGVDGLRGSLTAAYHFSLYTDFTILFIISMLIMTIGSYLFSKIEI